MKLTIHTTITQHWQCDIEHPGILYWHSNESPITFYATPFYDSTNEMDLQIMKPVTQDVLFSFNIPCPQLNKILWCNMGELNTSELTKYQHIIESLMPLIQHIMTQYQRKT